MNFDCKVSEVRTCYIPQRDLKYASGTGEEGYVRAYASIVLAQWEFILTELPLVTFV